MPAAGAFVEDRRRIPCSRRARRAGLHDARGLCRGPELPAAADRNARRVACAASASRAAPQRRLPDPAALADWWKTLNDPILDQLVEQALARNKTAKQAYARVVEARARRGIAAGDFWPTLGASAGANRTNSESRVSDPDVGLSGGTDEIYNAGLDAGWELDLFGGKRRAFEASTAQLGASEADLRDVLVTLLGDVALSYVDVRTAQSRLNFAEKNLEAQRGVLDITQWRSAAGLATALDVEQAQEQLRADARRHPVAAVDPRAIDEPAGRADWRSAWIARSDAGGTQADPGRAAGGCRRRTGRRLAPPSRYSQRRAPPRGSDRAKSASRPPRCIRASR